MLYYSNPIGYIIYTVTECEGFLSLLIVAVRLRGPTIKIVLKLFELWPGKGNYLKVTLQLLM